jgi:hypothetical protein
MTDLAIDTHEFFKRLKNVGFSEEQAEVITDLQKTTILKTLEQAKHDYELDNIATRRDLKELETSNKRDIKELELKLEAKIAETKAELIRWVVAVGVLQTTIVTGLILKLSNSF